MSATKVHLKLSALFEDQLVYYTACNSAFRSTTKMSAEMTAVDCAWCQQKMWKLVYNINEIHPGFLERFQNSCLRRSNAIRYV